MTTENYVHGYSEREALRLYDQARSVQEFIHYDTAFPAGSRVLEAGCGVGAQTVTLAEKSPEARIVSADIAADSLNRARNAVRDKGLSNVEFYHADIFALPFREEDFDHLFVCYLLEHLPNPERALTSLRRVLKPGGSVTVIEGDHGSCYFYPETEESLKVWNCLIRVQESLGGNSLIGRQVFPLLKQSGFRDIRVSPRMLYMDQSEPGLMDSFVRKTIVPMVEGVKAQAIDTGLTDERQWDKGINDLRSIADREDGIFCYTFFKAVAVK